MAASSIFPPSPSPHHPGSASSPALSSSPHSHSRSHSYQSTSHFSPPAKQQPNNHPYAIKTTSTALLSRSTSITTQATAGHRYIPPASPSPSPTKGRFSGDDNSDVEADGGARGTPERTRGHRVRRHRYSRSLTSDALPAPLPPPPGAPAPQYSSYSNAYTTSFGVASSPTLGRSTRERAMSFGSSDGASEDDLDETPRRALLSAGRGLPNDPKAWTESELAEYLGSVEGGDAEVLGYVRQRGLTGRAFMRLAQADLEGSGLSQSTRDNLLATSRALRRRALRGKMFGPAHAASNGEYADVDRTFTSDDINPFDPNRNGNEDNDDDDAGVTLRRRKGVRTRSRQSSIASNSSQSSVSSSASTSGRVRDMIVELERKSTLDGGVGVEEGSTSESGGLGHRRRGSASPTKHLHTHSGARALPHRPSVNDLFSTNSSTPEADIGFGDAEREKGFNGGVHSGVGGTAALKRNVHGREARLLPFPPTGGNGIGTPTSAYHAQHGLTPAHTGTAYPLPATPFDPLQTNKSDKVSPPTDYELGFRHATSPSTFVVQHNPSPVNLGPHTHGHPRSPGSSGKQARLLPYPPIVQETALHHPRPRRLVGTGLTEEGEDSDVSDGLGGMHERGETDTMTTYTTTANTTSATDTETEAWETALESGAPSEDERAQEEPSIAELLAHQGHTNARAPPISGVEAWEMELGDTVKRIGAGGAGGATRSEPSLLPGSARKIKGAPDEIGRKAGRAAGTGTGKREKEDGLKRGGIIGLFADVPEGRATAAGISPETGKDESEKKTGDLDERERALSTREAAADSKEKEFDARDRGVRDHEAQMTARLGEQDSKAEEKENGINSREKGLNAREEKLGIREEMLKTREKDLERREESLGKRKESLDADAQELQRRENAVHEKESTLAALEELVGKREAAVAETQRMFEIHVEEIELREKAVDIDAEQKQKALEDDAEERKRVLEMEAEKRRQVLQEEAEVLHANEKTFDERQSELTKREQAVTERERTLSEKQRAWDERVELEKRHKAERLERKAIEEHEKQNYSLPIDVLRSVWGTFVLPIVGDTRTPTLFRSSTASIATVDKDPPVENSNSVDDDNSTSSGMSDITPPTPKPYLTSAWAIRRDAFLGRFTGVFGSGGGQEGYLTLMSIGMVVVVLRVLGKRGWGLRR